MEKTEKVSAEQRAERIGRKAVSDDYIEDGGYIRDWLVNDIAAALRAVRQEALEEAETVVQEHYWGGQDEVLERIRALKTAVNDSTGGKRE